MRSLRTDIEANPASPNRILLNTRLEHTMNLGTILVIILISGRL